MKEKRLPGLPLYYHESYGFEKHLSEYDGNGINRLRTPRLAQPRALKVGDILATGDKVLSAPREGGNGLVLIHLTGGTDGHWIDVPARVPIALLTKEDKGAATFWKMGDKNKHKWSRLRRLNKTFHFSGMKCVDGVALCKPTGGRECVYCGG